MGSYRDAWEQSIKSPNEFWGEAAKGVTWYQSPSVILDDANAPLYRWFSDGVMNTCYNAIDRHVEAGRGAQRALIYDSPVTGVKRVYTYDELLDEVSRFAGALQSLNVTKGDRVVIYMPMIPEALIAMLACARIGAIHSVVFGGFAAHELAMRINDAAPKVVVSASCGIEVSRVIEYKPLLDAALTEASHHPHACVIVQRPQAPATMEAGRDFDWNDLMASAAPAPCVPVRATDPLYILYTSGTTGRPKGVVRDNGGHAVALTWSMPNIYDTTAGEVFWAASDVGWVVGHSYIVYAPLLAGATTLLYEGKPVGTPDAGAYWRVIAEWGVKTLFTAPTGFRAVKREDPTGSLIGQYDLSGFKYLFLAGERLDPETYSWASEQLGVPVIDHWWQTETGWAITAGFRGLGPFPFKPGSGGRPSPGYDLQALDEAGTVLGRGASGSLAVRLPLPPGAAPTLWRNEAGFRDAYLHDFPGWYRTGDAGMIDADGDVWVMGRTDDIINTAGHRLSTGAMEEVLASHPDVAECAVIGAQDALKGQVPLGLVVLKAGVDRASGEICAELVQLVRERIGPVASFKEALVVPRLPKTRSGKILRAAIRRLADGEPANPPPTIEDPAALDDIADALQSR